MKDVNNDGRNTPVIAYDGQVTLYGRMGDPSQLYR